MINYRYSRWDGTQNPFNFDEDDIMEALSDDLMAREKSEEQIPQELIKARYDKLRKKFVLFKDTSSQMLSDARDLRREYSDDNK